MSIEVEIFGRWVRKSHGIFDLFQLMKAEGGGHEGLTAVQRQVNRGGKTFTETYYVRQGQNAAIAEGGSAGSPAKQTQPKPPPMQGSGARATQYNDQGQKMWHYGMTPLPPESTLDELRTEIGDKLPGGLSFDQHLEVANQTIAQHKAAFKPLMDNLKSMAPPDAVVSGRVKTVASSMGKCVRKPDSYPRADALGDVTGTRITCSSIDDVLATVEKVKAQYEIVGEDDYITKPNGTYRSYHLAIKDKDGSTKEVQVRTANQNTYADWCHDIYKPLTPEQKQAVKSDKPTLDAYGKQMSDWFHAQDTGKEAGPKPQCPQIVGDVFGCL